MGTTLSLGATEWAQANVFYIHTLAWTYSSSVREMVESFPILFSSPYNMYSRYILFCKAVQSDKSYISIYAWNFWIFARHFQATIYWKLAGEVMQDKLCIQQFQCSVVLTTMTVSYTSSDLRNVGPCYFSDTVTQSVKNSVIIPQ